MRRAAGDARQRSGRIVNISSVAAVAPIPFQAWYSASKAAVNALTMAAANEVRPWGIAVAVMPGDTRTGFTAARKKKTATASTAAASPARCRRWSATRGGMTAQAAAKSRRSRSPQPPPGQSLGLTYKACAMLAKFLPARAVRALLRALYAR